MLPSISETYLPLTNIMEQSHSTETDNHSTNQEIPCVLWNLKVH